MLPLRLYPLYKEKGLAISIFLTCALDTSRSVVDSGFQELELSRTGSSLSITGNRHPHYHVDLRVTTPVPVTPGRRDRRPSQDTKPKVLRTSPVQEKVVKSGRTGDRHKTESQDLKGQ